MNDAVMNNNVTMYLQQKGLLLYFLMNVFIALKGIHFLIFICQRSLLLSNCCDDATYEQCICFRIS